MILYTDRLILRPFNDDDAESVYKYASDKDIGPAGGFPPHRNAEESLNVIRTVFTKKVTFAICLKDDNKVIGSIGFKTGEQTDLTEKSDECEIGYWLGKPFHNKGIMTEAVCEILRYAFRELKMNTVWAAHYDGNLKSRRVMEKCGMKYHHTTNEVPVPLLSETRKGHVLYITKEMWENNQKKE